MEDIKKVVSEGQGPENAKELSEGKDNNSSEIMEDSVVFYRSWFECFMAQGAKNFTLAMIAFFSIVFYGKDIKSFHLPRALEAIIEAFLPIVTANLKKRKAGSKGGAYGIKGGRPSSNADCKTPMGLTVTTPMGDQSAAVYVNGDGNANRNVNGCVYGGVNECGTPAAPHTDIDFYLPIFFFKNVAHPRKQAEKFVNHYTATGWTLGGGDYMATDQQRMAAAVNWQIKDDAVDRFHSDDLQMWRKLYEIAPPDIKNLMLDDKVRFIKSQDNAIVCAPTAVSQWIEANAEKAKPIICPWMATRKYVFSPTDK